jgi:hypothetical protein
MSWAQLEEPCWTILTPNVGDILTVSNEFSRPPLPLVASAILGETMQRCQSHRHNEIRKNAVMALTYIVEARRAMSWRQGHRRSWKLVAEQLLIGQSV